MAMRTTQHLSNHLNVTLEDTGESLLGPLASGGIRGTKHALLPMSSLSLSRSRALYLASLSLSLSRVLSFLPLSVSLSRALLYASR